uniref:Uncharacterized protein n=1 Tax=Anguilla anguilla TaxID=7936 RepID=A0A0E9PRM2_ANGAN
MEMMEIHFPASLKAELCTLAYCVFITSKNTNEKILVEISFHPSII